MTAEFSQERIARIESAPETVLDLGGEQITVTPADFEITSEDMPGWLVSTEGKLTVALDITLTDELRAEGAARELINRIQNIRKESGFEVTDKIRVEIEAKPAVEQALAGFSDYIAAQTLAVEVKADGTGRCRRRGFRSGRRAAEDCRDAHLTPHTQYGGARIRYSRKIWCFQNKYLILQINKKESNDYGRRKNPIQRCRTRRVQAAYPEKA